MKKIVLILFCLICISGCQKEEIITKTEDITPPWINVEKYLFETTIGAPVNYDTAIAYDAIDGPCDVTVSGIVNFQLAGEYYLKYISKDTNGNVSEEAFTVIVKGDNAPTPESNTNKDKTEKLCDLNDANDASKPCNTMITDVSYMESIFQDELGLAKCKARGNEYVDKKEIQTYTCEKLMRNDNQLWGYGLLTE